MTTLTLERVNMAAVCVFDRCTGKIRTMRTADIADDYAGVAVIALAADQLVEISFGRIAPAPAG